MRIPKDVIDATVARVRASEGERVAVQRALAGGKSPLKIDTQERVAKRLVRLHQDEVGFERMLGKSNLIEAAVLERSATVCKAIGRVRIRNARRELVGSGTGFMVSGTLLMTNNHVLRDPVEASRSQIEFNYQTGLDGKPLASVVFDLDPGTLFVTDRALDFTIVAVRPDPTAREPLESFGFCRLKPEVGKVLKGEPLNIIQHPNGEPKQVAIRENTLTALLDDFLHYETDTAPGSSGSPVFNDQWEVVALHHSGVPATDDEGNYLNLDGKPWDERQGEHRLKWIANEGVRISRIVHGLTASVPAPVMRDLLEEVTTPHGRAQPPMADRPGNPGLIATAEKDGSTTIVVPVSLNIRVGVAGSPAALVAGTPTSGPAKTPDLGTVAPSGDGSITPGVDRAMADALAELERARAAKYYDAAADEQDRDAYYEGIDPGIGKQQLYDALQELLSDTHHTELRYQPARHVYPLVDLQPNGKLRSIYSSKEFEPEEFIREDFRTEVARAAKLQEIMRLESSRGVQESLDVLEALLPYNCEHVVPQSWFAKKEPMRGDLHHLFACESGCNSFRQNIPYWDFPDFEEAEREDCGKRIGTTKFEPSNGKGEVARAVLYFLLRYPGEIDATEEEYQKERLKILVAWHKAHEITEHEKHRNAAIFKKQGNRNPLIDFPDLVDRVDFGRGLG